MIDKDDKKKLSGDIGDKEAFKDSGIREDDKQRAGKEGPAQEGGAEGTIVPAEEVVEILERERFFDNPGNRIILYVIIGFALLLILLMINRRIEQKAAEKSFEYKSKTNQEMPTAVRPVVPKEPVAAKPKPGKYRLPEQDLFGTAPIKIREGGPVISAEKDPELAAIADGLRIRVEIINGIKSKGRGDTITETSSGDFQGFMVNSSRIKKPDGLINNEIIVITPSKGSFVVKDGVLDSMKNCDYEKIVQELEDSGIGIIKKSISPGNGVLKVQLQVIKLTGSPLDENLLIAGQRVGRIEIGMMLSEMRSVLPRSYSFVEKRIELEEKYIDTIKVFDEGNNALFFVNVKENRVDGIQILNRAFRTDKGIGIGSNLGSLKIYHTNLEAWSVQGSAPLISVDGINGIFILEPGKINLAKGIFPDEVEITSILVGEAPY